ncbi:VOC family protein [Mycolicibacterium palauense]|uniref:VOC family protein n=1 Tax=Mycolicibacterium palauense TaxID=2034511 RepID=UPI000BFF0F6A|nr:VOC family protein [Mycolicibacterium palauense]
MALTAELITVDCADPERLGGWWAQAVGGEVIPVAPGEYVLVQPAAGPRLGFQRVEDATPGKNRVHVDFGAPDMEAEVARLVSLGATETGRHAFDQYRWVTLSDPDGNAFCVTGN